MGQLFGIKHKIIFLNWLRPTKSKDWAEARKQTQLDIYVHCSRWYNISLGLVCVKLHSPTERLTAKRNTTRRLFILRPDAKVALTFNPWPFLYIEHKTLGAASSALHTKHAYMHHNTLIISAYFPKSGAQGCSHK